MGLFVSFEGPDGSGKTTLTKYISEYFESKDTPVLLTREPGGISIAEKIREIVLDPNHKEMDDRTEALLYAASRRQHIVEKIKPALEEGKLVLCDRFVDSSLAYQGYARGIGIEEVWNMNLFAIESFLPNVTIFIDIDPIVGLNRTSQRGAKDRLELAGELFHQKVYEGYKEVIGRFPDRIKVIDGNRTVEEIAKDAIEIIEGILND